MDISRKEDIRKVGKVNRKKEVRHIS